MNQKPKTEPKDKIERLVEAYDRFEKRVKEAKEKEKSL